MKRRSDDERAIRERVAHNFSLVADFLHKERPDDPRAISLERELRHFSTIVASNREPAGFVRMLRQQEEMVVRIFPDLFIAVAPAGAAKSYESGLLRAAVPSDSVVYPSSIECLKLAAIFREVARRLVRSKVQFAGSYVLRLRKLADAIDARSPEIHMAGLEKAIDFVRVRAGDADAAELLYGAARILKKDRTTDEATERWLQSVKLRQWVSASATGAKKRAILEG